VFQLSNQSTLGESEGGIIFRLERTVRHLVKCEQAARVRLAKANDGVLLDMVGRAYGTLKHAWRLSNQEALAALFAVRLGIVLGLFDKLGIETVNRLIVSVQPGHLRLENEAAETSRKRRLERAAMVRQAIANCV
jgi:protein arginine kinase